jgi:carboxymethylenebutenolidase
MLKIDVKMRSSDGPEFDCYVVMPEATQTVPAIVLASAIYGVDSDLRAIAEEFGCRGYIAAAPDLFWRTQPGPLLRGDWRAAPRGQPRLEKLKTGERDLVDVLTVLRNCTVS